MNTPLSVAVIGSGPSGFYTAGALLDTKDLDVRVDMYERLPTPWGLVRAGVAPDHPKIKSVSAVYAKIAARPGFRFFGNVEIGRDIDRATLTERYDAVVYAVGTQTDRSLGVPGEDLPGSVAAVEFVGWYNGHPDFADRTFDLQTDRAVVIGNGNVALDVARILCSPYERLAETDIADHALKALRASTIKEVLVVGRRGAAQAAFTTPELRELPEFTESSVDVDPAQIADAERDESLPKTTQRNISVLRQYADEGGPRGSRHIALRFLRSPVEIRGSGRVEQVVLGVNELQATDEGKITAVDTGRRETVDAGLVLRAVGYRGVPIDGLPYDESRGIIPNDRGRVRDVEREYVTGWIKRGPSGIIGTNKKCAAETVSRLLEDLASGALRRQPDPPCGEVAAWVSKHQPDFVTERGWQAIDEAERAAGSDSGRPRVKLCTSDELLDVALDR